MRRAFSFADPDDKLTKRRRKKLRVRTYEPNEKSETAAEITNDEISPFSLRFDVPPQEAIDFFRRKQVLSPDDFYRLEGEARSGSFAVSKLYRLDLITAFRDEMVRGLEQGRTVKQIQDRLRSILDGAGHKQLGNAHLEAVVRTTMQVAYGVGRRRAMEETADYLPVWEYSAVMDDRTRPTHRALDGLQYPHDHPFWRKYYPPWDFRCRCTVIAVPSIRTGYDRNRPNSETVLDFDRDGLPTSFNVAGTPGNIKATDFVGIPPQLSLSNALKAGTKKALKTRK